MNTNDQLPLSEKQWLLINLAEECSEVAHRVSKSLRFGLNHVQAGKEHTNSYRLTEEVAQLTALVLCCFESGILDQDDIQPEMIDKVTRLKETSQMSVNRGLLVSNNLITQSIDTMIEHWKRELKENDSKEDL